ncbi:sulfite exporter TauE/SafE family protein [Sporosarcina sp. PTS2304]|uniref:sulfite exporter TauE/SafE family protein n=1 Tax=Sporosarcina sp. PTS2304 TaxID=2283194 RepID=UPI000E0D97E4|nr:sulfite exporter TauE/SafE family protein [Sporosarcina sp. PTS2304]AXI00848.1 sulfite exporter TauE/SafE family protein [Sporosarcina sp. PTS2304]
MSISFIITIFLIGFVGSFLSGMMGIGGAIVKYPMLLFIPALLGFTAFSPHDVSGITAVEVFFASLSGVLAYRKSNLIVKPLVLYMGISVLVGSVIGGAGSSLLSESTVNIVYGVLAVMAAIMMFIPKKGLDDMPIDEITFNRYVASGAAFIVGLAAGIVGAGGAFILVPVMLVILKIPTRVTIATSLAITLLSSVGSATGKIFTGQVPYGPALVMIVASIIAAPIGVKASRRVNTKVLQGILAVLIMASAVKIWWDIF